jgi:hypothetical protein
MDQLVIRLFLSAKKQELSTLRQLQDLIALVSHIGSTIHELQRERGLSNIVMYSPDAELGGELVQQLHRVDCALMQTEQIIEDMLRAGHAYTPRLKTALALALQCGREITTIRQVVASHHTLQEVSYQPCEHYSVIITNWLNVVIEAAGLSISPRLSQAALGLIYLLQAKEYAGQERAWGVIAFSGKTAGVDIVERLTVLARSQQDNLQALWSNLSADLSRQYKQKFEEVQTAQFDELRKLMFGLCTSAQASPVLAELWFFTATHRIDLLQELITPIRSELEQQLVLSKQSYDKEHARLHQQKSAALFDAIDGMPQFAEANFFSQDQTSLLNLLRNQTLYISAIEQELSNTKVAVDELKIIQRAKLLLIEKHKLSEQQAHHQLQKLAMDRQQSLKEIASQLLKSFAGSKHT